MGTPSKDAEIARLKGEVTKLLEALHECLGWMRFDRKNFMDALSDYQRKIAEYESAPTVVTITARGWLHEKCSAIPIGSQLIARPEKMERSK